MTYNSLAAMITQAYMNVTGTTIEQVAAVCVACRKWAMLQPNAMFNNKEITIEKVVNARMVSYPLTTLMCNVLGDGGSAFIMTTAEKARKVCDKPVYFLGEGSDYSHRTITRAKMSDFESMAEFLGPIAETGLREDAAWGPRTWTSSRSTAPTPCIHLIIMDALGIVRARQVRRPGGGRRDLARRQVPVTTNGEALCFGHTGTGVGFALLVESVRQLQGKAGKAQVEGAKFLIENCGGGRFHGLPLHRPGQRDTRLGDGEEEEHESVRER